jgi:hypothetical protein
MLFPNYRTVIPEDFTTEQGNLFAAFARTIDDQELAARLSDLAWVISQNGRRDINMAIFAIENYIKICEHPYWLQNHQGRIDRLERALRLSLSISNKNYFNQIKDKLMDGLDEKGSYFNLPVVNSICKIFLDLKVEIKTVAEKAQFLSETATHPDIKYQLLITAARGFSMCSENIHYNDVQVRAAEALVEKAFQAKQSSQWIVAAYNYRQTIIALQNCKGQQDRIIELKKELIEANKHGTQELQRTSVSIDLTQPTEKVIEYVKNTSNAQEALIFFALFLKPCSKSKLENDALEIVRASPIRYSAIANIYSPDNRIIYSVPPLLSSSGEEYTFALNAACCEQAKYRHSIAAQGVIIPARNEILKLYKIDKNSLFQILSYSSFIPQDRIHLWVKGFLAGFDDDFTVALHLLMPQFEHALRKALEARGQSVWRIDQQTKFSNEKSLNELFELNMKDFFDEDLYFELRTLLVERIGGNVRNECLHGLLPENYFYSYQAVYLWWLLFHTACRSVQSCELPERL